MTTNHYASNKVSLSYTFLKISSWSDFLYLIYNERFSNFVIHPLGLEPRCNRLPFRRLIRASGYGWLCNRATATRRRFHRLKVYCFTVKALAPFSLIILASSASSLRWLDSNQRIQESRSCALDQLGDTSKIVSYDFFCFVIRGFFRII